MNQPLLREFLEEWQMKKLATGKDGNTRDEGLRVFSSWSDSCGTSNRFWIFRGAEELVEARPNCCS